MQLLREFIHPQEVIDTTDKTDGSGEGDLDYQNDHIDMGDPYDIYDLDDLGSQDDQDDLGELGGLEDLDYQDDHSDEDDQSDQYDQGYLADVDEQDDMDGFVYLRCYQGFLPPGEESDNNWFIAEQNVVMHF
ncbi:hypothetical protein V5799_013322 [Amblyomma americanum]|uniref:Uncharacterized protein n=1 Tax=Amblyomma americanum TaxID=6943 RepID=A0AAQ4E670_AMBAM